MIIDNIESILTFTSVVVIFATFVPLLFKLFSFIAETRLINKRPVNKIKDFDNPKDKRIHLLYKNIGEISLNRYVKDANFRNEIDRIFTSPEFLEKNEISINHKELEKLVDEILIKLNIRFTKNFRVDDFSYDYIIYFNEKKVPMELKVYPKRIIDNQLVQKLRSQIFYIMSKTDIMEFVLIILNPGITNRAREELESHIENRPIYIIQSDFLNDIENDLIKYLISRNEKYLD
ncbi:MAG: hypothetical protein NT038_06065 [Euryarchaeota archaeon]|nr:hypothetical protein [Euryarchaeota archaeon]